MNHSSHGDLFVIIKIDLYLLLALRIQLRIMQHDVQITTVYINSFLTRSSADVGPTVQRLDAVLAIILEFNMACHLLDEIGVNVITDGIELHYLKYSPASFPTKTQSQRCGYKGQYLSQGYLSCALGYSLIALNTGHILLINIESIILIQHLQDK